MLVDSGVGCRYRGRYHIAEDVDTGEGITLAWDVDTGEGTTLCGMGILGKVSQHSCEFKPLRNILPR